MKEVKEYLKELIDQGVIHRDVGNDIIYLIKKHILKEKV